MTYCKMHSLTMWRFQKETNPACFASVTHSISVTDIHRYIYVSRSNKNNNNTIYYLNILELDIIVSIIASKKSTIIFKLCKYLI